MRPVFSSVLIKVIEPPKTSLLGIYVPGSDDSPKGTIVAVGTGKRHKGIFRPLSVKVGEVVVIKSGSGIRMHVNGEKLLLIDEDDIVGVLDA